MGKQLKKEEWVKLFKFYEKNGNEFLNKYFIKNLDLKCKGKFKTRFRNKYKRYSNGETNIIVSMTGKNSTGRPRKKKKITWDDFTRSELIEIAKRYRGEQNDKTKKEKMCEARHMNINVSKIVWLYGIPRSGFYKNKNIQYQSKRNHYYEKIINESFLINKGIYGRERLREYILKNIQLPYAIEQLGIICMHYVFTQKQGLLKKIRS